MMTRDLQLAESRREVATLADLRVSEVTPSRRDFAQYTATQRSGLAVVARLQGSATTSASERIAQARAYDDAEVAALAVVTDPSQLTLPEMAAIAAATSTPLLRDALCLDRSQVLAARLHGADAVLLPVAELGADGLAELVAVARSLHMAALLEVCRAADIASALGITHATLALRCVGADHQLDIAATLALTALIPKQRACLVLPEVRALEEARQLLGHCDAILLDEVLTNSPDVGATVASFLAL